MKAAQGVALPGAGLACRASGVRRIDTMTIVPTRLARDAAVGPALECTPPPALMPGLAAVCGGGPRRRWAIAGSVPGAAEAVPRARRARGIHPSDRRLPTRGRAHG
jgi:hypothetical protein